MSTSRVPGIDRRTVARVQCGCALGIHMRRRNFVFGVAATSLSGTGGEVALRNCASARNICFGSEVTLAELETSPAYADLIARECEIITPGLEAKWPYTEPEDGRFTLARLDRLVSFAKAHKLRLHMHNLIWSVGLPKWTIAAIAEGRGADIMARHISTLVSRYQDRVDSWDVINEPADPRWPSGPEGLCTTPWRKALGASYVAQALRDAAEANPHVRLMINDDDLEYEGEHGDRKRSIYLRLIGALRRHKVPLQGFGLEAHLKPWLKIADAPYRRFLSELAGLSLAIYVTELDVCDREMPGEIRRRDLLVADATKHYLDIALDEKATKTVITWGLSDRTTWMLHDPAGRRREGNAARPLPYDAQLRPKAMRAAIMAALVHAPDRSGMSPHN